ncbi:MAG: GntR family transcriptional regulator [Pseudomonadota bacterium]
MSETATTRATEALRALIFSGALPPGSDHLEAELAERLGLSRTPVREALARLEGQGLVTIRPRRGARIVGLSPSDMNDIYEVLTTLEAAAAGKAAERGLSEDDLSPLQAAIDAMDAALAADDLEAWALADDAFHLALVAASGNMRMVEATQIYADQVRRARMMTLRLRPPPTRSNNDHRAVLAAIKAGDARAAAGLHERHRDGARLLLTDLLRAHQLNWL